MQDSQQQPRNLPLHASHAMNSLLLRRRGGEHYAFRHDTGVCKPKRLTGSGNGGTSQGPSKQRRGQQHLVL